jgi:hypothetical protein
MRDRVIREKQIYLSQIYLKFYVWQETSEMEIKD